MAAKKKRPRDLSQRAKLIVDIAVGEVKDTDSNTDKDQAAQALGRKGGRARAKKISAKRRAEIARKAAQRRWATRHNGSS